MSSSQRPVYLGIDLGTTNSSAAVFDGEQVIVVRNAQGAALTPSVVRIDRSGRTTVGGRARKYLERDSANTRAEFKRLMGTGGRLLFEDAGVAKAPEELAAAVLGALRGDVRDQLGIEPTAAVISVPALFELPQSAATSEAARLAGFERVELIAEPVASALAAGWSSDSSGTWMVYDIGGGTFDCSLLETRDGLLRVIAHDGDNFLGGRDFDWAIVEWLIERIGAQHQVWLSRAKPQHSGALQSLKLAAEEAKIELSRAATAVISLPAPLVVDGHSIDLDLELDRADLERACAPVIDKTLAVCARLLTASGLAAEQLAHVVLVGGPTVMPVVRRRLHEQLGVAIAEGHDPMTLVARGAAIYAATAGLDARPAARVEAAPPGRRLWLQHPAVSADLTPHVVGRVMDGQGPMPERLRLVRENSPWSSPEAQVSEEGAFVLSASLVARSENRFRIEAYAKGAAVAVHPAELRIVQGITISDPPLSRTIGVALASDQVRVYFERGAPLPARRTFTIHTIESAARGAEGSVLKIPIVQGELDKAHLCRLVGTLEISGASLQADVPTGTAIELTIELDRGGRMNARARIPSLGQVFEEVAHLLVPDAVPAVLEASLATMRRQLMELRGDAFRAGRSEALEELDGVETRLAEAASGIEASRGGDADAGHQARRLLIELDAELATLALARKWPELEADAAQELAWASTWVAEYGSATEQQLLDEASEGVHQARAARSIAELQRQLRLVRRLGVACYNRDPEVWQWRLEAAASEVDSATDLPRAQELVSEARAALAARDQDRLKAAVRELWRLLPADVQQKRLAFDSSVR